MTLRPHPLPPVPEATVAAVQAAFPRGNPDVALRAAFGTLSEAQLLAARYPPGGRPVAVAPWRFALVVVRQYSAGLTDRQAAAAVRRGMDWKDALRLARTDPGFDCT
jgi:transposase